MRALYEYVMPNGFAFQPQAFRKAVAVVADNVNTRREDVEIEGRKRDAPVVFWYLDFDGNLYGEDGVPEQEGGKPMNLASIRRPPFFDWSVVGGPGGRYKSTKEPDLGAGWVRHGLGAEVE